MDSHAEGIVRCASCNRPLPEPRNIPMEDRIPCRNCGGMNRNYEASFIATVVATADVVVEAPPARATASASAPQVVIDNLEDAGFDLQWLRMSEGGAWMLRVFDREGKFIDGSIQDDPADALLAVAEQLLP